MTALQQPRLLMGRGKWRRLWTHAQTTGIWDALRCALIALLSRARPDDSAFDRRHGTETRSVFAVRFDDPPPPGQVVRSGSMQPAVMRNIIEHLGADPRDLTFIDFGSGKGRALLCAAAFPFRRIIGVEWSTDLCGIARRNVEIFRARHPSAPPIEVNCQNVLEYALPAGPLVVYIFNPFGPTLTRQVLEKIGQHARTVADPCLIVYAGVDDPLLAFLLDCFRSAGIRMVRDSCTLDLHSSWILAQASRS